jgi:hypothetical protein
VLTSNITRFIEEEKFASNVSSAMESFWEGMALFSTIFAPGPLNIAGVLDKFQERILEIL